MKKPYWTPIKRALALAASLALGITCCRPLLAQQAEEPGSKPLNPFGPVLSAVPPDAREAIVELSNGKKMRGLVYLTPGLRWRFYDEKAKRYLRIPLTAIRRVEATVTKEWMEREWRFKEAASNEKVYTGRKYPVRILSYRITLKNGRVLTGRGSTVLYLVPEEETSRHGPEARPRRKREKLIIQERQKGKPGETLRKLVYVKSILFDPESEEEPPSETTRGPERLPRGARARSQPK